MPVVMRVAADRPDPGALARAARVLLGGGLVVYPTDTLYGLGADPASDAAVERLFAAKGRDAAVALPLVAADLDQVEAWIGVLAPDVRRLAQRFWPGPLSLVVPAPPRVSARLLGGGTTVAIRVPDHAVAAGLARAAGRPITSTSANRSGAPPSNAVGEIDETLIARVDLVIDAGTCRGGPPSTIVDVAQGVPRLVRDGAVPWSRVLEFLNE